MPSIREPRRHQPAVHRIVPHQVPELGYSVYGLFDAQAVGRSRGDELGEPVGVTGRDPQQPGYVLERCPRLQGSKGDDLTHALAPVTFPDVLDHFTPAFEAEVHVDVRHGYPLGIQEALEQQIEPERIDVGDAERIGDQRAGGGTAAGAHGDPALPCRRDEVLYNQEVTRVSRLVDHPELVGQPLLDCLGQG